jgi:hypothetical protein
METITKNTEIESVEELGNGNGLYLFSPFLKITVFITVGNKSGIFQKILNMN